MNEEPQPGPPAPSASSSSRQITWRLVLGDGAAPERRAGPENMAIDQALLDSVAAGADPVVRLYRWAPATLSFGRNQPARGLYDRAAADARGIGFVRRPTGGQAVLHDDELTYAVVAPVDVIGKPRVAYGRVNEALVAGLGRVEVEAEMAGVEARGPGSGPGPGPGPRWTDACFRRPARGEVVAGGRKLVGSAQRTEGRTILQHGSILLGGTQAPAEELLVAGGGPVGVGGWTTVESELRGRRPGLDALVSALASAFEAALGITLARSGLTAAEEAGARELRGRFASDDWTWRR